MLLDPDQKGVFDEVAYARKRTIIIEEYKKLVAAAPDHFRDMLIGGVNNGMGPGELQRLRWIRPIESCCWLPMAFFWG